MGVGVEADQSNVRYGAAVLGHPVASDALSPSPILQGMLDPGRRDL